MVDMEVWNSWNCLVMLLSLSEWVSCCYLYLFYQNYFLLVHQVAVNTVIQDEKEFLNHVQVNRQESV
jgi:hypothetical protein